MCMCICNMCKYLPLEFCILYMLLCLWLRVVYLLEEAGCSAGYLVLHYPLLMFASCIDSTLYSVYVTLFGV
jgi:hypothetical protein